MLLELIPINLYQLINMVIHLLSCSSGINLGKLWALDVFNYRYFIVGQHVNIAGRNLKFTRYFAHHEFD